MEQPDTNGKIAIMPTDVPGSRLFVWDVSDPTAPSVLAEFTPPKPDHMWTCVLGCRYVYGGRGTIVDLKDPSAPRVVGDWAASLPISAYHSIEEVAPGVVLTGTIPSFLLHAGKNPRRPIVRAATLPESEESPSPLAGAGPAPPALVDWPRNAKDRFALMSTETPFSGTCSESSGSFQTYDTKGWKARRSFRFVDEYRISQDGTFADGGSPYNIVGCSPYAFAVPPRFAGSRVVAVPWFEQGMRLLKLSTRGRIKEVGGFLPIAGSSSTAIWIDDEVLYLIDLVRGIDILEVKTRPKG